MAHLWFARKERKPIRKKRKEHREFRSGKVIANAAEMYELRMAAFTRSDGYCECGCGKRVFWDTGELHHETKHGTRTDELSRVKFLTKECHKRITGDLQWSKP